MCRRRSAPVPFDDCHELEYRYSATQNNGQITQQKDWVTGEEITYTYDSLSRLATANATGVTPWGFSFSYDGYGNLTGKTGSPSGGTFSATYDAATNHQNGLSYDANGNQMNGILYPYAALSYDVENRLGLFTGEGAGEVYGYDPSNKRVWKRMPDGVTEEFYLYGVACCLQ